MRDACRVEKMDFDYMSNHFYTLPKRVWERDDTVLISTGSLACVRTLYFSAWEQGKLPQFVACPISRTEYAEGVAMSKLAEALKAASRADGVAAIVIYASCAEVLTQLDEELLLREADVPETLPVKALLRGPLAARTHDVERELDDFLAQIPSSAGRVQLPPQAPPLSPDFCGVLSVLQDFDVYPFLLTAGGCTGCIAAADGNPVSYRLSHSRFSDLELAEGCEDMTVKGIAEGFTEDRHSLCCIAGSAIPHLVGVDISHISDELNNRGVNAVELSATGFAPAQTGIANCLLSLGKRLISAAPKDDRRVDVMGYSELTFGGNSLLETGVRILEDNGYHVSVWGSGETADIVTSSQAALNWVVSAEGIPLAAYMRREYEVPFVMGLPFGASSTRNWTEKLGEFLDLQAASVAAPSTRRDTRSVLLIGQPVIISELRQFLMAERGFKDVKCGLYAPLPELRDLWEHSGICGSAFVANIHFPFLTSES